MKHDRNRGLAAPFRHRDFRYLAGGLATSQVGDWLYNLALLVFVLEVTGSAGWVAAAGVARLLPYVIFGALGGAVADRYPRRAVMIASDLARAIVMGALAWVVLDSESASAAVTLTVVATSLSVAYSPCVNASVPRIVTEDELAAANSIVTTITNVSIAVGPAIGGVMLVVGSPAWAFALNGVTFVASALLVSRIRCDLGPDARRRRVEEQGTGFLRHVGEGFSAITSSPDVLTLVAAWTATALLYGLEVVLLALVATERLGTGANGLALLYSAFGIGSLLAVFLANRAANHARQGMILAVATMIPGLALAGFALTHSPAVGFLLAAVDGASSLVLDVLIVTSLQRLLGNERLGRAYGATDTLVVGGLLVGTLLAPWLVSGTSLEVALAVSGGVVVVAGLLLLVRARSIDRRAAARAGVLAERVAQLAGLDLFAGASRATLEAVAAESAVEPLPPGAVPIRQGDEPDDLFVVVEGQFVVSTEDRGVVAELGAGEYFGEIGLLRRVPRTATVTATSEAVVLRISGKRFLELVGHGATPSAALLQAVQARLARSG